MTTNAVYVIPTSATARRFAISASRPRWIPAFTTRRRSSTQNVVGQYLRELIPVAGGEVRRVALVRLACRVLQPPRLTVCLVLEPGMRGVEFGDRGIHVFEVEPDLQRDSTLFVDAVYLEKFVLRRPRARIGSAHHHSSESQALASHGDIVRGEAHAARP